jgi:hypothetical protein
VTGISTGALMAPFAFLGSGTDFYGDQAEYSVNYGSRLQYADQERFLRYDPGSYLFAEKQGLKFNLGLSPRLNGAKIRAVWDDLLPPRSGLGFSSARRATTPIPRCCPLPPRHRLEAYATLTPSRGSSGRAELPSGSISTNRSTLRRAMEHRLPASEQKPCAHRSQFASCNCSAKNIGLQKRCWT